MARCTGDTIMTRLTLSMLMEPVPVFSQISLGGASCVTDRAQLDSDVVGRSRGVRSVQVRLLPLQLSPLPAALGHVLMPVVP